MKWLIWAPAIAILFSAVAVPGGLALFALPLLALGYFLVAVIALGGSEEHRAATRASPVPEERDPPPPSRKQALPTTQPEPVPGGSARPLPESAA